MKSSVHKDDNRAASDVLPPPPKVDSLKAIMRLRPKRGSQWCTFAFVLNRDIVKPDGSLDDLHAMVFPLGAFENQTLAEEHAKNIISITGHPGVIAAQYGTPVPLTTKFDPNLVTEVAVDPRGRLIELESAQFKREREEYERRAKQERDIMKEAEDETDNDSIEHFKRQCFVAIKNRSAFQVHTKEAESAWQNYKKREMNVRDHFARHPEHEQQWLPYLKEKLTERGELDLYFGLEAAYKEIRDELLGLVDDESSDHISPIELDVPIVEPKTIQIIDGVKKESSEKISDKQQSSSSDDCEGGVCMVTPKKVLDLEFSDDDSDLLNKVNKSESSPYDDDEMIAPEDIPVTKSDNSINSDPGFIDEHDDN